jgi:hypothetical protein
MDESWHQLIQLIGHTLVSGVLNVMSRSLPLDVLARLWRGLVRAWHPVIELRIDVLISDIARAAAGGK